MTYTSVAAAIAPQPHLSGPNRSQKSFLALYTAAQIASPMGKRMAVNMASIIEHLGPRGMGLVDNTIAEKSMGH